VIGRVVVHGADWAVPADTLTDPARLVTAPGMATAAGTVTGMGAVTAVAMAAATAADTASVRTCSTA
jgi:hypothetical protein